MAKPLDEILQDTRTNLAAYLDGVMASLTGARTGGLNDTQAAYVLNEWIAGYWRERAAQNGGTAE